MKNIRSYLPLQFFRSAGEHEHISIFLSKASPKFFSILTDDRAVFFQTFQHVLVRHGVGHACQWQDHGPRARVHQQHRYVADPERGRVQCTFQALGVGERHVTPVVRQAHRPQFVPETSVLDGVDDFVHLRTNVERLRSSNKFNLS